MVSHQPESRQYRVMCETMFYGGLRPSEVIDLRLEDCWFPADPGGFGELHVRRAFVGLEEPGDPKTGNRRVHIPSVLVEALEAHSERFPSVDGFLFRTRTGSSPTGSNWRYAHKLPSHMHICRSLPHR